MFFNDILFQLSLRRMEKNYPFFPSFNLIFIAVSNILVGNPFNFLFFVYYFYDLIAENAFE